MSEYNEQVNFVSYCRLNKIPIFAIPNGFYLGSRNKSTELTIKKRVIREKKAGLEPGIPDLLIPVANRLHHGLFIEMKFDKNKPKPNQIKWIDILKKQGYKVEVYYSCNEAIKTLNNYLQEKC